MSRYYYPKDSERKSIGRVKTDPDTAQRILPKNLKSTFKKYADSLEAEPIFGNVRKFVNFDKGDDSTPPGQSDD